MGSQPRSLPFVFNNDDHILDMLIDSNTDLSMVRGRLERTPVFDARRATLVRVVRFITDSEIARLGLGGAGARTQFELGTSNPWALLQ